MIQSSSHVSMYCASNQTGIAGGPSDAVVKKQVFSRLFATTVTRFLAFVAVACPLFFLGSPAISSAADPLSNDRKLAGVGWAGLVGVPNGIPARTTIFATLPAGSSAAAVQNAVYACPSGQVVQLSAGFYSWSSAVMMTSNVTLRGAGSGVCGKSATSLSIGTGLKIWTTQTNCQFAIGDTVRAWNYTDGNSYMQGTVTAYAGGLLTVNVTTAGGSGTVANWVIGNMKWTLIHSNAGVGIDSTDSSWWNEFANPVAANHRNWTGGLAQGSTTITVSSTSGMTVGNLIFMDQLNDADIDVTSTANPDGPYLSGEYTSVTYPLIGRDRAQVQVNRIKALTSTTITLYEPVYMPNIKASQSPQVWCFSTHPTVTEGWGVENLCMSKPGSDSKGIQLGYCYGCWVQNCFVTGPDAHDPYIGPVLAVRPEIRHNYLKGPGSIDDYGVRPFLSAGMLMIDNVGDNCGTLMMLVGISGSVYAYNFGVNLQSQNGYQTAGMYTHGGMPHMILMEGNYMPQMALNVEWQDSAYMVGFRNRLTGKADGNFSVTGHTQAIEVGAMNRHASVIGSVLGTTGIHTTYEDTPLTAGHDGHRVYVIGANSQGTVAGATYDSATYSSLLRAVNWDSANGNIVGNGYTVADLPSSYFLNGKPNSFGSLAWPAFDPSNPSLGPTAIPAGYRYYNGVEAPGIGGADVPPPAGTGTPPTNAVIHIVVP